MVHNPGGDDCILSGGVDPTYTFTHENPLLPKAQQELHGLCGTLTSSSVSRGPSVFLRGCWTWVEITNHNGDLKLVIFSPNISGT